ncbi:MAG: low molecular weight protein-tyrosine-phosphatase [Bacteroidota bacterium]
MKILMVCLGNICRSPLAEGILKHKIKEQGLDWEVASAGTSHWHVGEPPDHRSVAVARRNGIDIRDQRGRQFVAADLDHFDLIYAMDSSNYNDIKRLVQSPSQAQKVELIMNLVHPGHNQNVPDPYYGNDGFKGVFDMLDEACEQLVKRHQ